MAKDNERYQSLFGGENMVVLFTVDEGKTVVDLFTPGQRRPVRSKSTSLCAAVARDRLGGLAGHPLAVDEDLITKGVASEIIARTIERETDPRGRGAAPTGRAGHGDADRRGRQQDLSNP